ncbi:amidase [Chelatococcus sp. SYSU_G07232]|uniref:Amidase n=1 Tax=Chelatococcus albus TaxID=3047466 RepID=A0ABT7AEF8_9HYPH|nr:amidase [Chelatococcus sp. SYSU_G07232]MDJ1157733.1 amidase [Chelatococcus sp. SYSU_G07232]
MDLLNEPAHAILAALDRRELSAAELLDETLERIAAVNPALNAIVALDTEAARTAADAADARRGKGEARALDGLVITIKDAFDVAGLVSTAGAPTYRERVPERDAAAVARLRAAGAVILGKTNVPAFSGDFQAYNPIYGATNNPWDRSRSTGGSSGGAAAAVATGMSAFELGSDLGGSIRWPAHACGIFGLKPTWGLVSTRGHVPPPPGVTAEGDLVAAGPLARSAADLDLVLSVIAGPADPDGVKPRLAPPRRTTPAGLRVALWANETFAPVDASVSGAVERAGALLAGAGATVDAAARPAFAFEEAFEVYALMNHAIVAAGLPQKVRDRLAADAVNYAPGDLSHRALQARGARLDAGTWVALQERRQALKTAWDAFFRDWDVVLMPPAPVPAIPHDHSPDFHARTLDVNGEKRPYFDFLMWSSLASGAHLPAAVAPVAQTAGGLPLGVQIVAAEGADRTAIAVAGMLEALGCRYRVPPLLR